MITSVKYHGGFHCGFELFKINLLVSGPLGDQHYCIRIFRCGKCIVFDLELAVTQQVGKHMFCHFSCNGVVSRDGCTGMAQGTDEVDRRRFAHVVSIWLEGQAPDADFAAI